MGMKISEEQDGLDAVTKAINEVLGKKWMIAIWVVEPDEKGGEDKRKLKKRVSWRYPTGDFDHAVKSLKSSLDDEIGVVQKPKALSMADFKVFSGEGIDVEGLLKEEEKPHVVDTLEDQVSEVTKPVEVEVVDEGVHEEVGADYDVTLDELFLRADQEKSAGGKTL